MRIGLIGDIHGQRGVHVAREWMSRTLPDFCLQIGDYWSPAYYEDWPVPVHWIFGNHEKMDVVRSLVDGTWEERENNHWLMGGLIEIQGIVVMALPGLPSKKGDPGPASFPPRVYEECWDHAHDMKVDVFISHGAPFPFWGFTYDSDLKKNVRINFEEPPITDLVRRIKPKIAVSGHNHRFSIEDHEGIQCIRMGWDNKDLTHMIELR